MESAHVTTSSEAEAAQSPRTEFAGQLAKLHLAAGKPSLRWVAAAARRAGSGPQGRYQPHVSAQRISDWKSGRNVPARFDTLIPVLTVLGDRARRRGPVRAHLLNLREWRQLWDAAQPARKGRRQTPSGRPPTLTASNQGWMRHGAKASYSPLAAPTGIYLGCDDPDSLAEFYLKLLEGQVLWGDSESIAVSISPALTVVAQRIKDYLAPTSIDSPVIYFGIVATEDAAELEVRALGLGANRARSYPHSRSAVLLDPAGHAFFFVSASAQK
ncbi:VOC family protein [Nocardia rhizosphaerae]|uniref:VOC family protein n=1 Tax=Nocardia rhizosphaerae TaxID=1691571 RepID=A0ABV8LBP6_9NOCA